MKYLLQQILILIILVMLTADHGGGLDGFRTYLLIRMDTSIHVTILTNGGDETEGHSTAIRDLIDRFYTE